DLKTTKKDMHNHGMGIGIIKNIASRYNGRCDFYEENGFFNCLVVINPEQH
ncbi:MAG: GHKL domain-containing protein, partial [Oscillospiraceae bacterium]|nr:GHKL domain-containing protein [Oscillospiraceae bacterium]